jgi:hypothetical protein
MELLSTDRANLGERDVSTAFWDVSKRPKRPAAPSLGS